MSVVLISACGQNRVKKAKEETKTEEAARINVELASGYIRRGQLEVAHVKLEKALEVDDTYVPAYTTMAILMEMKGEIVEAQSYYLEALDIDHRNPELLNNYGTFLCKQDKIEEAIKQFEKVLKNQFYERPEKAHANLGYCILKSENPDYKKAEKHIRKALKINPNMPSALIAMGELGLKTKKYLTTRAFMQRYHSVARASATSLWYQAQAEKALGDQKYFLKFSRQLLKNFPDSPEAEKLMELTGQ
ncbi:MAG: type IV pilus biogenesis/stability protein PilW [Gammaproteobacteria bacterium]|nr:type IV pilus biogenesis/stability protein PilW [Gammaproteobacteria bacterium]